MKFEKILDRFEDITPEADGGYLALCPAHPDSRPSLRIWRGADNKVRLHCRAGCETSSVVAAAKLNMRDLFNAEGEGMTVAVAKPVLVSGAVLHDLDAYVAATADALSDSPSALDYLFRRFGVTAEDARQHGIGFDDDPENLAGFKHRSKSFLRYPRVTVPLRGFDGIARGLQGRDIAGGCPMRWVGLTNPAGSRWAAYGVLRGDGSYPVVVVTEGPGDGLTAASVGYDAVFIRGAALAVNPDLIAELADGLAGRLVLVAGDNDASGRRFNTALFDGFAAHGIEVRELRVPDLGPKTDITKWRESDPSAFAQAFHAAVRSSQPMSHEPTTVVASGDSEAVRALADAIEEYGASDAMSAYALVAWAGGRIKYSPSMGFYTWNGRCWERDVVKVRQEIHRMGAALKKAGKDDLSKAFTMTDRINHLLTELKSVPAVYVESSQFDARHDLLNFRNGTVNLRTGELRPHAMADMLTHCLDLDYEPSAKCDRWDRFLSEIFPGHDEMRSYMQRLVGYGITGLTSEEAFAVLWGKGANGKSVFLDTLTSVFRDVSRTTAFSTFEDKGKNAGIPNDVAALRGSRLVMASEGEAGKPMSEGVLKRLTGKDMVTARFLHKEFFEFKPSFLILLATNHKPQFKGQDEGLWRRVKLIPFSRYFAPHERDYELDSKLIAEAAGIAAWAVRGAMQWFESGLADPAVITDATREYRESSDALAGFFPGIIERCEPSVALEGAEAYDAFRAWCEDEGLQQREIWTRRAFYRALDERDIERRKRAKGIVFMGVRLSAPAASDGPGIFNHESD